MKDLMKIVLIGLLVLFQVVGNKMSGQTSTPTPVMEQDPTTGYWTVKKQVPLVGEGRVVNSLMETVSVLSLADQELGCLVDENLDNGAKFKGSVADASLLYEEIVSVKDINRVYAANQKVGIVFAFKETELLSLDVLSSKFVFNFYLKGKLKQSVIAQEGDGENSVVNLELLSFKTDNGKTCSVASVTAPVAFDEIGISNTGINVSVLSDPLEIRYFFVGENPEIPAVEGNPFFETAPTLHRNNGFDVGWTSDVWIGDKNNIVDNDLENGAAFSVAGALFGKCATVRFNKEIPSGYEVGYRISSKDLLSLGLLSGITLKTYDDRDNEKDAMSTTTLLGVSVASGSAQNVRMVTTKPCTQLYIYFGALNVKLGETTVHYAYVRKPTTVGPDAYLSLANDTIYSGDSYQLYVQDIPTGATLSFSTVPSSSSQTFSVDSNNGLISGMSVDGDYTVKATLTMGDEVYEQNVTITRKTDEENVVCNTLITEKEYGARVVGSYEKENICILCFEQRQNVNNLVDGNPDNYVTFTRPINLVNNTPVIAVDLGEGKTINAEKAPIRVGFTMQYSSELLNVNALEYFYIRLYKDGERVDQAVPGENSTVKLDLLAADSNKMRYSIVTDKEFDHIELWYAGVANIHLFSSIRLYNAFWEPDDEKCRRINPSEVCNENIRIGADIWYAKTGFGKTSDGNIASVLSFIRNLGNLLDNDPYSYATFQQTAEVSLLSSASIGIKLDEPMVVPEGGKRQFGFTIMQPEGIASVGLLNAMKLYLYNGNTLVAEAASDQGVLDLNLIAYGDKAYIETTVGSGMSVDGLVLEFNGIEVLSTTMIYGVYTRLDANGNGIPDCSEEVGSQNISVSIETNDICIDEGVTEEDVVFEYEGETTLTEVYCEVYQYREDGNFEKDVTHSKSCTLDKSANTIILPLPCGDYYVQFKDKADGDYVSDDILYVTIHPKETTWKGGVSGKANNWNEWYNWKDGAPWSCTNVIIPSNASTYPELVSTDFNPCNYIHFEPHAEVVNTPYLTYNKAWVEIELAPNRYYMVATPIKGIYSGNWFISKEGTDLPDYFTDLKEENYPANRVTPTIYQRLWEHTAQNKLATGGDGPVTIISETKWTAPYNHMATSYEKRSGYDFNALSVWVHSGTPDGTEATTSKKSYKFRFPKMHTTYFYSDMDGDTLGLSNNLTRKATTGRFIYEAEDGTAQFPITMTYQNEIKTNYEDYPNHQVFLVGNPFMSHIDIEKFFDKNDHIKSIKVESTDGNYSSVVQNDNTIIAGSGDTKLQYIPPMQSFFVELSSTDEYNDECSITYTEDMLTQQPGVSGQLRSSSPSDAFYLSASASGQRSSAMLRFSASASDYYHEGEDADILIDDEVPPAVAVFTVADCHALDIQQRASGGDIPIGFVLPKTDEVTLRIDVPEEYAGWVLNDLETGKNYALRSGTNELNLGRMLTNVGRFSLRGSAPTGNEVISASQPRIYCFREEGSNTLVVRSAEGMMARCEIYTLAGQLSGIASYETNEYRLPVPPGIKIVPAPLWVGSLLGRGGYAGAWGRGEH